MVKNYFSWVSIFLLILSLIAFSDNLFYDIGQDSNNDPKFIIHGLFFLAWFIILVIQSNFIKKGDYRSHRKWGMVGMGIALGVILSTFYVFIVIYEGWEVMPAFIKVNRIFTFSFSILIVFAYIKRHQPTLHKRYLFIGTFYVLGPVIGRVAGKFLEESQMNIVLTEGIIWNGLFISLILYDMQTLKKVHPITWVGFSWFYIFWIYSILAE